MMSFAAAGSLLGAVAATRLHRVVAPRVIVVGYPWLGALAALLHRDSAPAARARRDLRRVGLLRPDVGRRRRRPSHPYRPRRDAGSGRERRRVSSRSAAPRSVRSSRGVLASRLTGSAAFVCVAAIGTVRRARPAWPPGRGGCGRSPQRRPRDPAQPRLLALLAAEVVSRLGSQMTFVALPWFVLVTTGSPAKMGIVLAFELAPVALLGVPERDGRARATARADDARL